MRQVTTPTTLPTAKRNAIVRASGIQCQAVGCTNPATRWSNLCGLCELKFLQGLKPVFGKPTADQLKAAQAVIKERYRKEIYAGVFDDWCSQIARTFARPLTKLETPLTMKGLPRPSMRYESLLALRTRDRGNLTTRQVINLFAYALVIDALITPTIPQPVRQDYMIALLGQKFMSREVYSRAATRLQPKRVKTGWISYGPDGPFENTELIYEEVKTREFFRIRRADMRYIGRRLWKAFEKTLLAGGRTGDDWRGLGLALQQMLRKENA